MKHKNNHTIFEFKYTRSQKSQHINRAIKKAENQIYKTGALLLKTKKTTLSGCVILISDYLESSDMIPIDKVDWTSLLNPNDSISKVVVSSKQAFEIALEQGIIISPYEQSLIRSSVTSRRTEDLSDQELKDLVLPSIIDTFS